MIDFEDFAKWCPWATISDMGGRCCSATRGDCGVPGLCFKEECGLMYALSKGPLNKGKCNACAGDEQEPIIEPKKVGSVKIKVIGRESV